MSVNAWAVESGISPMTIWQRIHRGWSLRDAVLRPAPARERRRHAGGVDGRCRYVVLDGVKDSITGHAKRRGISASTVYVRLKKGWPVEKALSTERMRRGRPPGISTPVGPRRVHLQVLMGVGEARTIALGSPGARLGKTSKMPGYSFGLDAFRCIKGQELAKDPNSSCFECYAMRDFYATWTPVKISRDRRHAGLEHPRWVDAMVTLILNDADPEEPFFRWHDSGDIMSVEHLERVVEVCRRTPTIKHWMPTKEYGFVADFLKRGGVVPDNLVIRLSAYYLDQKPDVGKLVQLRRFPTSTVHTGPVQVRTARRRNASIACKALERDNTCGRCRACWEPRVQNVSYPKH